MGQQGSIGCILVGQHGSIGSILFGQHWSIVSNLVGQQPTIGSILVGQQVLYVVSSLASMGLIVKSLWARGNRLHPCGPAWVYR